MKRKTALIFIPLILFAFLMASCSKDLNKPVLAINGQKVEWSKIENAESYILKINEDEVQLSSDITNYDFSDYPAGEYNITLIAKGKGYNASISNTVKLTITVKSLAILKNADVINKIEGQRILLTTEYLGVSVEGGVSEGIQLAVSKILFNDEDIDFEDELILECGEYKIFFEATDNDGNRVEDFITVNVAEDDEAPFISITNYVKKVLPSSQFTINLNNLAATVVDNSGTDVNLNYQILYNNEIEKEELTFVTAEDGFYNIKIIAEDQKGNLSEKQMFLLIEGTYLTYFDNLTELDGIWVANNTVNGISLYQNNGNKEILFSPSNNYYVPFNIPLLEYPDDLAEGDKIKIGFDVRIEGTFPNEDWLLLIESVYGHTTVVKGGMTTGGLVDGKTSARFEVSTQMMWDANLKQFRIAGFRFANNQSICQDMKVYLDNITLVPDKITYDWSYDDPNADGRDVYVRNGAASVVNNELNVVADYTNLMVRFYNKPLLSSYTAGTVIVFEFDVTFASNSTALLVYNNKEGKETVMNPQKGQKLHLTLYTVIVNTEGQYVKNTVFGNGENNIFLYLINTVNEERIIFDNLNIKAMDKVMTFEDDNFTIAELTLSDNNISGAISSERAYQGQKSYKISNLSSELKFRIYNLEGMQLLSESEVITVGMYIYLNGSGVSMTPDSLTAELSEYFGNIYNAFIPGEWIYLELDLSILSDSKGPYVELGFTVDNPGAGTSIFIDNITIVQKTLENYNLKRAKVGLGGNIIYQVPSITTAQNMCYIIKNNEGKIFVLDGGFAQDAAIVENIIKMLMPVNPTVELWLISHGHGDHMQVIASIINNNIIKINNICYDIPAQQYWDMYEPSTEGNSNRAALFAAINNAGIPVITPQEGQVLEYGSLKFKILYVPDLTITENFGNNTSVVYKMITDDKDILFLGDLGQEGGSKLLEEHEDDIKCEIVQMAHHGQNGVNRDVYIAINPQIALWPTPGDLWNNVNPAWKTLEVRGWMEAIRTENYVTKDGIAMLF